MSEWEEMTLGGFLTLKRGYDLPQRLREDGKIPIYSSSGISGFHNKKNLRSKVVGQQNVGELTLAAIGP